MKLRKGTPNFDVRVTTDPEEAFRWEHLSDEELEKVPVTYTLDYDPQLMKCLASKNGINSLEGFQRSVRNRLAHGWGRIRESERSKYEFGEIIDEPFLIKAWHRWIAYHQIARRRDEFEQKSYSQFPDWLNGWGRIFPTKLRKNAWQPYFEEIKHEFLRCAAKAQTPFKLRSQRFWLLPKILAATLATLGLWIKGGVVENLKRFPGHLSLRR